MKYFEKIRWRVVGFRKKHGDDRTEDERAMMRLDSAICQRDVTIDQLVSGIDYAINLLEQDRLNVCKVYLKYLVDARL